jgi:hypothetical protein
MWMDSDRDEDELERYEARPEKREYADSNAYWRRRFLILAGGIVVLGLCVWLIPGGHDSPAAAAARESAAAAATRNTLPPAAYGPAYAPKPTVKPSPTVSKVSPSPSKSPKAVIHPTATASGSVAAKGQCPAKDIVLSLFTSSPSYGPHDSPTFNIYAVSTSAAACTLTYGPGAVQVLVTRKGHVVWDSASCDPRPGSPVRFTLGVPQPLTVVWDRAATKPAGCGGTLSAGSWGTFDVVAMTAGQSSPLRSFVLDKS